MIDKKVKSIPKKKKLSSEKVAHYTGVLVEDLKSQFQFVVEHVMDSEARITKRMDERFERIEAQLQQVIHVVSNHSTDIAALKEAVFG